MRKNFTQILLGMALLVGFVTMGNAQCEIDPPPGAIYNFQFDGAPDPKIGFSNNRPLE